MQGTDELTCQERKRYDTLRQTPSDNCSFENEVRLLSSVEDLDEHPVHVVSLDPVPEERNENEVVA